MRKLADPRSLFLSYPGTNSLKTINAVICSKELEASADISMGEFFILKYKREMLKSKPNSNCEISPPFVNGSHWSPF